MYILPLILYKFELFVFKISNGMKKIAHVMALLAPLYATAVLARVVLDVLLPEHSVFKFIELSVPTIAGLYAIAILYVAIRDNYKLANVKAVMVAALPWVLMLIYNLI